MIRHLLKLVWNRKRINGLLIVEICVSFLVLFAVCATCASLLANWLEPLGYQRERVWYAQLEFPRPQEGADSDIPDVLERLLREVQGLDEVEAACLMGALPYDGSTVTTIEKFEGRPVESNMLAVSREFDTVFAPELVAGRWFEAADETRDWNPIVINERLARDAFGDADPVGQALPLGLFSGETRVVGVVQAFRKDGELSTPVNYTLELYRPRDSGHWPASALAIKVSPRTTAEFEPRLLERIHGVVPTWTARVQSMDEARRSKLSLELAPLVVAAVVAGFLLLMVALGLVGVLWQNVTQRTREIGLRRAAGAHRGEIYRQVIGEVLVVTTVGGLIGLAIIVQVPVLGQWGMITPQGFVWGIGAAVSLIYALAALAALYPGWLAARVNPAEALHYE